jgi:dynein heavy chain
MLIRLLFGLAFFHAVIVARRRYGTLGWSTPYEFTDSDLTVSVRLLRHLLDTYDAIPYRAILGLIGEVNYGGRVTDDWDRRALLCVLQDFCAEKVHSDAYRVVPNSSIYCIPSFEKLIDYQNYVRYAFSLCL